MTPEQAARTESCGRAKRAFRWVFVSRRSGRLTFTQWPNAPLVGFLVFSAGSRIFHRSGGTATVFRSLGLAALIVWALDEVVRGVSPFRRVLGSAVLVVTIADLALR